MSKKLYVGNLAFQTTSQDLQQLFGQAGTVESAQIIEDRDTYFDSPSFNFGSGSPSI